MTLKNVIFFVQYSVIQFSDLRHTISKSRNFAEPDILDTIDNFCPHNKKPLIPYEILI